ncbi:MAG TPA: hypothetical protein VI159_05930 [Gemmatimonadales bacterium]|nr:hypothetical protein [Gemmatimonadales bacterium]HWH02707.1 hypothetical protein [Gemmatimonadales bacterium]
MTPEEGIKFLFLFLMLGGAVWVLRPIGKAIARKLEGQAGADARALEQMRDELLGEVDGLRQDVAQLSERLDFTERMLAKQTEQPRVGPGAR